MGTVRPSGFAVVRRGGRPGFQGCLEIKALAREGAADAVFLKNAEQGQIEFMAVREVLAVMFGGDVAYDADVEGAVAEFVEEDGNIAAVDVGRLLTVAADGVTDGFQLLPRAAVGYAEHVLDAEPLAPGAVGDGSVGQQVVRHVDQFLVERADARASESDVFHDAFDIVDLDPVADLEGLFHDDDETAEDIGQGVLGGEAKAMAPMPREAMKAEIS